MDSNESNFDSFLRIERIIRQGELSLSELEHLLDDLVSQQHLTSAEQEALLALAWQKNIDHKRTA